MQDPVIRDVIKGPEFAKLMESKGISNDTTVVVYGDKNNWFAAYAYWYMKLYGHADVRIMDGGRQKWIDEDRELSTQASKVPGGSYTVEVVEKQLRARRDDVLEIVKTG